jgi:hypothetical protein
MNRAIWTAIATFVAASSADVAEISHRANAAATERPSPASLVNGWRRARESVRQGHLRLEGRFSAEFLDEVPVRKTAREVEQVRDFDELGRLTRLDYSELQLKSADETSDSGKKPQLHNIWIQTPELTATRTGERRPLISIERAEEANSELWDLRILGICTYEDFVRPRSFDALCKRMEKRVQAGQMGVEATQQPGVYRLTDEEITEYAESRVSYWIDVNRGFTPIRMEHWVRRLPDGPQLPEPVRLSLVEWREIRGLFVPVSGTIESRLTNDEITGFVSDDRFDFSIEWSSVNDEVDPALFTIENLVGQAENCFITDSRSGQRIVIKDPAIPDADRLRRVREMKAAAKESDIGAIRDAEKDRRDQEPRDARHRLLVGSVIVSAILLAALAARHFRKKTKTPQ